MSVILGLRDTTRVVIAGDNRATTKAGNTINDCTEKVIVVNHHLACATAGNCAAGRRLLDKCSVLLNKNTLITDDLVKISKEIQIEFSSFKGGLDMSFAFLIAGKGNNGKISLIDVRSTKQGFIAVETNGSIIPPTGMNEKECNAILALNQIAYPIDFIEKTIQKIASINSLVSPTGTMWFYDLNSDNSVFSSF